MLLFEQKVKKSLFFVSVFFLICLLLPTPRRLFPITFFFLFFFVASPLFSSRLWCAFVSICGEKPPLQSSDFFCFFYLFFSRPKRVFFFVFFTHRLNSVPSLFHFLRVFVYAAVFPVHTSFSCLLACLHANVKNPLEFEQCCPYPLYHYLKEAG